jgi:septum formation protein
LALRRGGARRIADSPRNVPTSERDLWRIFYRVTALRVDITLPRPVARASHRDTIGVQVQRPTRLILASASPRRHELVARLGLPFDIVEPRGVDEGAAQGAANEVARTLASWKAEEVLEEVGTGSDGTADPYVLGADTVVAVGEGRTEEILGKPRDADHARRMLRILSGRTHAVWTGVALARPGFPPRVEAERTRVTFHDLSDESIEAYVTSGEPMGKAGAYAIQGLGSALVREFEGCYYNIVGLPLLRVARLLRALRPDATCDCERHPMQRGRPGCGER